MSFKPLRDIVLVERHKPETKSSGGIVLPGAAKGVPDTGTVLAVGPGYNCEQTGQFVETSVKVGDTVVFTSTSGYPIKLDGYPEEDILTMREVEIMGVLEK